MNELSTERAIEALHTIRAYYASLTAGYPKGKDCKGIGDVMCSEIANSCLMGIKALEQQPCEDCISRQAAKSKAVYSLERHEKVVPVAELDWLPPVEPERKPGKWIDGKCNKCGTHAPFWEMATTYYCSEYCPKCGAKMEVEE